MSAVVAERAPVDKRRTTMNRSLILLAATAALSLTIAVAAAPETAGPPVTGEMRGAPNRRGEWQNPLREAVQQLELTEEQSAKLKVVWDDEKAKLEALRADTTATRDEKRATMQEIRQSVRKQVEAILTPAQRKQVEDFLAAARENRRGGAAGQPGPRQNQP